MRSLTISSICLLLVARPFAAEAASPNAQASYWAHATYLRGDLLSSYDKAVPPSSVRTAGYSQAGTDVQLQVRFFKVQQVTTTEGRMALKVWLRMWWSDLRLSWDPAAYGGITQVKFNAASFSLPEDTEICAKTLKSGSNISSVPWTKSARNLFTAHAKPSLRVCICRAA